MRIARRFNAGNRAMENRVSERRLSAFGHLVVIWFDTLP